MAEEGQYIYAIVEANEDRNFGPVGIGGRDNEVYTVCSAKALSLSKKRF
jgi:hypothetical protein